MLGACPAPLLACCLARCKVDCQKGCTRDARLCSTCSTARPGMRVRNASVVTHLPPRPSLHLPPRSSMFDTLTVRPALRKEMALKPPACSHKLSRWVAPAGSLARRCVPRCLCPLSCAQGIFSASVVLLACMALGCVGSGGTDEGHPGPRNDGGKALT
jgi:hypothetical protein